MAAGALVTVPEPAPDFETASAKLSGGGGEGGGAVDAVVVKLPIAPKLVLAAVLATRRN
jgi:hypothetical protein